MTFASWLEEVLHASAVALGGAGPVLAALWLGRTAIEKYIAARFANAAAAQRQAFEEDMATARDKAARELEVFRSELIFGAELRRQVAAKRVEALLALAAQVEPLGATLLPDPPADYSELTEGLHAAVSRHEHLFSEAFVRSFRESLKALPELSVGLGDRIRAVDAVCDRILRLLREELGTELRKKETT